MNINKLLHDIRNNIEYDEYGITKIAQEAVNALADIIEQQENDIKEKQKHLENLQKVNEDMEERIAIMTEYGLWIPVEERLPEIKEGNEYFGTRCIVCNEYKQVFPLRYCLHNVRGREVHRWIYEDLRLYYGEVAYWMPLPEPPKEGEAE